MERSVGMRLGTAIGVGIDAIVESVAKIGHDLQLDLLAEAAHDGAEAAGDFVKDGWSEWHEAQPITSTAVTAAAAATTVLAGVAGKRGLMLALSGSAIAGTLLLPIFLVELLQAEEALRNRRESNA
jgi:hypothetical protein